MTEKMSQKEISELNPGDLIYFWYVAIGDLDLIEFEIVSISDSVVVLKDQLGSGEYEFHTKKISSLENYSSRNTIEEFCMSEQCMLTGRDPRDFRPLEKR